MGSNKLSGANVNDVVDLTHGDITTTRSNPIQQIKPASKNPTPLTKKYRRGNKAKSTRPQNRVLKSDGKYRQFDVKCMLKLASAKSGDNKLSLGGEDVSLTQLDFLPLEMQLQVVNNASTSSQPVLAPAKPEVIEIMEDESECSEEEFLPEEKQRSESDLTVLRDWIDKHSQPSSEDIDLVKDFLCICVSEKRLDDVISFLRMIKFHASAWKTDHYQTLLDETEHYILTYEGGKLDLAGLGL